jgi:chromate reductase
MSLRILGIAGSLRRASHNRALLERLGSVIEPMARVEIFDRMTEVPLFNEDTEATPPEAVMSLWNDVRVADLILFATPEYNQGMSAATKNAVDWLSRDPTGSPLIGKPVAVTGVTVGLWGTRLAQHQLRGTLAACGAVVMPAPMLFLARANDAEPDQVQLKAFAGAALNWAQRC